jgi:hypothetical protein
MISTKLTQVHATTPPPLPSTSGIRQRRSDINPPGENEDSDSIENDDVDKIEDKIEDEDEEESSNESEIEDQDQDQDHLNKNENKDKDDEEDDDDEDDDEEDEDDDEEEDDDDEEDENGEFFSLRMFFCLLTLFSPPQLPATPSLAPCKRVGFLCFYFYFNMIINCSFSSCRSRQPEQQGQ